MASGTIHVLSQVMAAAAGDELFAKEIGQIFEAWIDVVHRALQRALGGSPLAAALPLDELASAVSALFVGIELLGELGAAVGRSESLFAAIAGVARLVEVRAARSLPRLRRRGGPGAVPSTLGGRSADLDRCRPLPDSGDAAAAILPQLRALLPMESGTRSAGA